MKQTGLLFFPAFDWAITPTHPEREERLLYTRDLIFEEGVMDLQEIKEYQPRLAEIKDIARVHFCIPDIESQILKAHLIAAGGSLVMADAFFNKEIKNAFAIIRPPGHHAMTVSHGNRGFCNINNEAIMVEYIRKNYGIKKIVIVDTDVHHGDGTSEIYYNDPDVLCISFHQDGRTIFPGTGFIDELGTPQAYGTNINIPLIPGTTDVGIHYILDNLILPLIEEFKPDLIVNSAGQDNHYSDPLANMRFTAQGYAKLNTKLAPDIAVLEGGYSVETALPYINLGIIMAMAGIDYSNYYEPDYKSFSESPENMEYIKKMVNIQLENFRNREDVIAQNKKKRGKLIQDYKSVFYDTEFINEEQYNKYRVCNKCSGYRMIDSTAHHRDGKVVRVYCISIPSNSCSTCQEEAKSAYKDLIENSSFFDYIYLQDRLGDEYRSTNMKTNIEKVL
ncbi:Deacetylase [Candidatus Syntrophocurvum alkaliphilum]|uniref:Deacetylase n=1 Tax=Candidatus Syntrophocurvum alkaliphilum TaxID=2293317 RepID=A0A6I6DFQ5_9FIRM|nr:histone deacetylase [Candidatus Syntrophocurvum alkaliphilum]QGT99434.1 Deacetylase [Candidatus Syntrophocurvum alkaliphilum]